MAQESWNHDAADGRGFQQQEGLVPCTNNCGFFGCAATMNLCSKCFRELSLEQGNTAFPAHSSEKLAMAATAEKSMISALSDKSVISALSDKSRVSMAQASLTPAVSEKPFDKSMVAVAVAQASLTQPAVSERSSVSAAAMAQSSQSLSSLNTAQCAGSESGLCSSRSLASSMASQNLSKSDLAPIAALFSSTAAQTNENQPAVRRQSVNRCLTCRKRTGLLGFKCRCGNVFCAPHRYSDKHNCPYDYKSAARDAIAKANPIVKAKKVEKI